MKLATETPTAASYAVCALTPDGDATAEAALDAETGAVTIAGWRGTPPPAWLETLARSLLRTVARNKNAAGAWPRRITRWRPEPRS
jgi:hypothetical protein